MTAVARPESASARPTASRRTFRVAQLRCTGAAPDQLPHEGRCQLLAGHDGPHAVMFLHGELGRTVRSWSTVAPEAWVDSQTAFQRPWAVGFPSAAWIVE